HQSANAQNRLIGFSYDAAGNLLNDGNHSYTYDAENRLTKVDGGGTASYVYDPFGQRAERTANGSTTAYLRDLNGEIKFTVTSGIGYDRSYIYFAGNPIAEYFEGTTYFTHGDHLGSTRLLTQLDRTTRECDDYYPFGESISCGSNTGNPRKFTGKERDAESGLDNFGARYYTSSMGRFMTPDWAARPTTVPYAVFGDPQSLNLYGYVRNDPVSRADADGHTSFSTLGWQSFLLGLSPMQLNQCDWVCA